MRLRLVGLFRLTKLFIISQLRLAVNRQPDFRRETRGAELRKSSSPTGRLLLYYLYVLKRVFKSSFYTNMEFLNKTTNQKWNLILQDRKFCQTNRCCRAFFKPIDLSKRCIVNLIPARKTCKAGSWIFINGRATVFGRTSSSFTTSIKIINTWTLSWYPLDHKSK